MIYFPTEFGVADAALVSLKCRYHLTPPECGGMAEWTIAAVLKTVVGLGSPGVRIPLPPPQDVPEIVSGEVPEWTIGAAC